MTDAGNGGGGRNVVITGIDVPFGRLVLLIIKLALAALPALIVLWLTLQVAWLVIATLMGFPHRPWRRWDW